MSLDTGDDTILIPISLLQFPSVSHKPCARTYGEQIVLGDVLDGRAVNLMGVAQRPQTILEHALQVLGVLVALGSVLANLRLVVALGLDEKRPLVFPVGLLNVEMQLVLASGFRNCLRSCFCFFARMLC